jgi:hypothetical protein
MLRLGLAQPYNIHWKYICTGISLCVIVMLPLLLFTPFQDNAGHMSRSSSLNTRRKNPQAKGSTL